MGTRWLRELLFGLLGPSPSQPNKTKSMLQTTVVCELNLCGFHIVLINGDASNVNVMEITCVVDCMESQIRPSEDRG